MNAKMWDHPITRQHIDTLKDWGYIEIPPANKKQMCGTVGSGAMAEVKTIVDKIGCYANQYKWHFSLERQILGFTGFIIQLFVTHVTIYLLINIFV